MKCFLRFTTLGISVLAAAITLISCKESSKVKVLSEHPERSELQVSNNDYKIDFGRVDGTIFDNEDAYQYLDDATYEQARLLLFTICYDYDKVCAPKILLFSRIPLNEIKEGTKINVVMLPTNDPYDRGFDNKRYEGQVEIAKKSIDGLTVRFNDSEFRQTDNQDKVWHLKGLVNYKLYKEN